jgi:hypothetical protein
MNIVEFDMEKLRALRKAYKKAFEDGEKVFKFEEHELLTDYAKYLIQHLDYEINVLKMRK